MALRERLSALNPGRTLVIDGVARPAIIVRENMEPQFIATQAGVFYIDWGEVQPAESTRPILGIVCEIRYASEGSSETGVDRGRVLAQMDDELVRICVPPHTGMCDYSQSPSVDLGAGVFWTMPELANTPKEGASLAQGSASPARLERRARLKVYFFVPEVGA